MDFQKEYQKWLDSGVLTAAEKAELEAKIGRAHV